MNACPKCKQPIDAGLKKCPVCQTNLDVESRTLDASSSFFQIDEQASSEDSTTNDNLPRDDKSKVEEKQSPPIGGTIDVEHFLKEEDSRADSVNKTSIAPEPITSEADGSRTILESESKSLSGDSTSTIYYSDGEFKEALGTAPSKSGSQGSRRVWEEATGSTAGRSRSSSQFVLEASDSVFQRIASRTVADANSEKAVSADYQIQDKIGEGGMGIVFSALQTAVNRKVAVKAMKPKLASDATRRRQFFYEAEITAELDHPNIPPIYEFGATQEGVYFYSMKMIQGTEWNQAVKKKTLSENLSIFQKVVDAIAFSHSKNIIHRDLKPENVILGMFGEVYLTDWGLAVNLTTNPKVPFGGTPDYMAPEMAGEGGREVGKHSDVYLLGAVLFQVLTGKPPHAGRNQREQLEAAKKNIIRDEDIDDPLMDVARKAMSTMPNDRYSSVLQLREAIEDILRHKNSIELTNKASELAKEASAENNYDKFNRALYGFKDAIELWPENKTAIQGLQAVRLDFGNIATARGDYDLTLQTLDTSIPAEAALHKKATAAKKAAINRDSRLKSLKRMLVAGMGVFLLVASGLALYAKMQESEAINQRTIAENASTNAKNNELRAKDAEKEAVKRAAEAQTASLVTLHQRTLADISSAEAQIQATLAEKASEYADHQRKEAERLADIANTEKDNAKNALAALQTSQKNLTERTFQKSFSGFASNSVLANLQISNAKVLDAKTLIDDFSASFAAIADSDAAESGEEDENQNSSRKIPETTNWATHRLSLLANQDLSRMAVGDEVVAIDFDTTGVNGIVGTTQGDVVWVRNKNGEIVEQARQSVGSRIIAVKISPNGSEALFSALDTSEGEAAHRLYDWTLNGSDKPNHVTELGNRYLQGFTYSPDGTTVLTGINRGIWYRGEDRKWNNLANAIRGELQSIGWIDSSSAFVLSRFDDLPILSYIKFDISSPSASRTNASLISLPGDIAKEVSAVTSLGNSKLLIGTNSGNLYVLNIVADTVNSPNVQVAGQIELPRRHHSAIIDATLNAENLLVTRSNEPLAHVWKLDKDRQPEYLTYLTGSPDSKATQNNIAGVAFVGKQTIASVDSSGSVVALDIERQQQRRRVVPRLDSSNVSNPKPVIGIHAQGQTPNTISINEDGVVDLWNVQTGMAKSFSLAAEGSDEVAQGNLMPERFSYFGHSPGSELIDSVVDLNERLIVTVADITKSDPRYIAVPDVTHEFCFWDRETGNLLERRYQKLENRPRLSLVGDGKVLVAARPSSIIEYQKLRDATSPVTFSQDEFFKRSPTFAVQNPLDKELVAIVRIDGVWTWNSTTKQQSSIIYLGKLGQTLRNGIWSEDGKRFYVVDNEAKLWLLRMDENKLGLLGKPVELPQTEGTQIFSDRQVDLAVTTAGEADQVSIAIRSGSKTYFTVANVPSDGQVTLRSTETIEGLAWLNASTGRPELEFGNELKISNASVVKSFNLNGHRFVATRSGNIVDFADAQKNVTLFGRRPFVCSTADKIGSKVWTLHDDGSILCLDVTSLPALSSWSRASFQLPSADRLMASPDGQLLAALLGKNLRIIDSTTGVVRHNLENVAGASWDPLTDQGLVVVHSDGTMASIGVEYPNKSLNRVELNGGTVPQVNFFTETWANGNVDQNRYLVVQTNSSSDIGGQDQLHFVSLDSAVPENFVATIKPNSIVAISPKDPLVVVGDKSGSVRLHFSSPTYKSFESMYEIDSEGDSEIKLLSFVDEGDTLVTSDGRARLYGWLSKDKVRQSSN